MTPHGLRAHSCQAHAAGAGPRRAGAKFCRGAVSPRRCRFRLNNLPPAAAHGCAQGPRAGHRRRAAALTGHPPGSDSPPPLCSPTSTRLRRDPASSCGGAWRRRRCVAEKGGVRRFLWCVGSSRVSGCCVACGRLRPRCLCSALLDRAGAAGSQDAPRGSPRAATPRPGPPLPRVPPPHTPGPLPARGTFLAHGPPAAPEHSEAAQCHVTKDDVLSLSASSLVGGWARHRGGAQL